ncbi:MAG: hypothetical protein M3R26_00750 [Actinomycetota bacterium]|nr:hypothetical protein [Actinomycetota bacterium]MDQ2983011.1 hypothetical protein [Actinomycetota bacterium]
MRRLVVAATCALLLAPAAQAATPTRPVYDSKGHVIDTPYAPPKPRPILTEAKAQALFLGNPKIHDWLRHYPPKKRQYETKFSPSLKNWTVKIWSGPAGEVATGRVDDTTGVVTEAWTGPQVAWKMARGGEGAFGGKEINSVGVWLAFCLAFLIGLADFRRPLSVRNLDLLALLSFTASLWYFNKGHIFTSVPLVYPPLVYLLGRMLWTARTDRPAPAGRPLWPVWVLAAATVFLAGFRIGLNVQASNVIDVGYSGVIGADRIAHGESPYGHFPIEGNLKACGPADAEGEIRERIQTNGRCESANDRGDTYGPVAYEAYLPAYAITGWSGKWDKLPAAHVTAVALDLLCLIGLALVGLRFGGWRLAATLGFAWAAWPFTQYVSSSNTNDALLPAFLIWGFWLVSSPAGRGVFSALAGWTKFAALLVAPLWASYPDAFRRPREKALFGWWFLWATAAAFFVLLLEPDPFHAARVFFDRTVSWQVGRESPFSIWDWRQYHAGLPDLHGVQLVLEAVLVAGAIAAYFLPRRKSPLQLAALTAALLIGFELVLTHWFYLYLPWFFPFVAFVVLVPRAAEAPVEVAAESDRPVRELVPAS